jgi:phosphatidate phosphatase APP1
MGAIPDTIVKIRGCIMVAVWACGLLHAEESVTKLASDESVTLFPALGWRNPAGDGWLIECHGWVYEQEPRRASVAVLQNLLGMKLDDLSSEEQRYFQQRSCWFLVDNERGKNLIVTFNGITTDLGETEADGHVVKRIAVEAGREQGLTEGTHLATLKVEPEDARKVQGAVHLIGEEGWTVVSDIDDTIKVTEVRNTESLVRNTFCRAFQAADGMAKMYAEWARQGAVFHYVSASPWQLYPDLEAFRASSGYPAGTFHLRDMRLKDQSGMEFLIGSSGFKPKEIAGLLARFPKRKFVLVGDTGEHDPEIYGELIRNHPGQVMRVLIRDVTGELADAERYRTAFQGVAREKWAIFQHPAEVARLGPGKREEKGR